MTLTADTITDEQIRELQLECPPEWARTFRATIVALAKLRSCDRRAARYRERDAAARREARAWCAHVLNTRDIPEDPDADGIYADGAEPDSDETLGLR